MGSDSQNVTSSQGFEVEIQSGGRAYDSGETTAYVPRAISPTRAAAKARSRRRNIVIASLFVVALAAIALWMWLSNPATNVPSDAVARVNGEYIYDRDIDRELDLTRVANDRTGTSNATLPSRAQVLSDLIDRKMRVQDAKKAGVKLDTTEVDNAIKDILDRTGMTQAQLEDSLSRHNLKLEDMRSVAADTLLINKYIADYVIRGATSDEDAQNKKNDWLTSLAQTSKIDRLKATGSGPEPRIGAEAPDFTLKDLSGKEITLKSLRGRPVMINFWATWCPPCRSEIPTIVQTYSKTHQSDSYEILGIATQSDEATVVAFAKEFGMNFPVLPDNDNRVTNDLYHVLPIPTSFFIDKDGIIRDIQLGPVDEPKLEKWLLNQ